MGSVNHDGQTPVLIYDGDCGFCRYWVRYWERLTGSRVRYEPYQAVADRYPDISPEEFSRSIQFVESDGKRCSGAHAAFRVLDRVPQNHFRLWLYLHLPGFAPLAEVSYAVVARHRVAAAKWSRWLWGEERYPDDYALAGWIFLRLIALIYLAAFASLAVQIAGLVGADGILPIGEHLNLLLRESGSAALWRIPTLFWLNSSDFALKAACVAGMAAAGAVFFDRFVRAGLLACYVLYLSLVQAGQDFLSFQWDMLLLESGFLALFLTGGSRLVIWLYRWLLFRFMLMSGVVKLASGDPVWRNLTALKYHFETQPLPSPVAWHARQLTEPVLQLATAAVFLIEPVLPWFVFMPRRLRLWAAAGFALLQGMILLTGNYAFFNLLTLALCVFLLEDRDLRPWLGARRSATILAQARSPTPRAEAGAGAMALVTLLACGSLLWLTNTPYRRIQPFYGLAQLTTTLGIVNGYGPFAVMTTERHEIVVEGSNDNRTWLAYEFRYKPGDPEKPLSWNIPHQPRLDWQMWFAALSDHPGNTWFPKFMDKLRNNSEPVVALLKENPFPERPPRYLRARLYRYSFARPEMRAWRGQTWHRELLGDYRSSMKSLD
jgi:predicted DCC family thiol-disulfide oxidoreductase YuxK